MAKKKKKGVVFRYIKGRVIPIATGVGAVGGAFAGGGYTALKTMGLSMTQEKHYQFSEKARLKAKKARSGLEILKKGMPTVKNKKRLAHFRNLETKYLKEIRRQSARHAVLKGGFKRAGRLMGKSAFFGTVGSVGSLLAGISLIGYGSKE